MTQPHFFINKRTAPFFQIIGSVNFWSLVLGLGANVNDTTYAGETTIFIEKHIGLTCHAHERFCTHGSGGATPDARALLPADHPGPRPIDTRCGRTCCRNIPHVMTDVNTTVSALMAAVISVHVIPDSVNSMVVKRGPGKPFPVVRGSAWASVRIIPESSRWGKGWNPTTSWGKYS